MNTDTQLWPYWFELTVVFGFTTVGGILFSGFAVHETRLRRLTKTFLGAALSVSISALAGREWFYMFVAAMLVAVAVIHGWWLPRRGINGWTAEPRERYLALRGWMMKG